MTTVARSRDPPIPSWRPGLDAQHPCLPRVGVASAAEPNDWRLGARPQAMRQGTGDSLERATVVIEAGERHTHSLWKAVMTSHRRLSTMLDCASRIANGHAASMRVCSVSSSGGTRRARRARRAASAACQAARSACDVLGKRRSCARTYRLLGASSSRRAGARHGSVGLTHISFSVSDLAGVLARVSDSGDRWSTGRFRSIRRCFAIRTAATGTALRWVGSALPLRPRADSFSAVTAMDDLAQSASLYPSSNVCGASVNRRGDQLRGDE